MSPDKCYLLKLMCQEPSTLERQNTDVFLVAIVLCALASGFETSVAFTGSQSSKLNIYGFDFPQCM